MEKFNNTTIFTGFLKQLLHNYNLPKYKVYTKEDQKYFEKNKTESDNIFKTFIKDNTANRDIIYYVPYIKDGHIQEYINGKWTEVGFRDSKGKHQHHFYEGIKTLNYTKNLEIKNNVYDSYTHEYLGDYLRFQRDFNNLDLMPLYNCFSNRTCDKLKIVIETNDQNKIIFDSADTSYKIYMVPVKLFKDYTIAVDSSTPIELCCGLYNCYQNKKEIFESIPRLTYKKFRENYFTQPQLYSKIKDLKLATGIDLNELAQNEDSLRLFIKLPANNTSSIVILEGDYCKYTANLTDCTVASKGFNNHTVINFEHIDEIIDEDPKLITPLQLLKFNTGEQHPFADRLIEYLVDNAITHLDPIAQNIARTQYVVQKSVEQKGVGSHSEFLYKFEPANKGFWDDTLKYIIYEYMSNNQNTFEENHDVLGYVDKDAEKFYYYTDKETGEQTSILNAELSEEDL